MCVSSSRVCLGGVASILAYYLFVSFTRYGGEIVGSENIFKNV